MSNHDVGLAASDYADLRKIFRQFFDETRPTQRADESHLPLDRANWRRLAREIGVQGLLVPERWGGSDAAVAELALAFEEGGRALLTAPLLATAALAVPALVASRNEDTQARFLPRIVDGECVATAAFSQTDELGRTQRRTLPRVTSTENGWQITGVAERVLNGSEADLVLVEADSNAGSVVVAVELPQPAVKVTDQPALDRSRQFARIEFRDATAYLIADAATAREVVNTATDVARVCLTAGQIGGAERCLETAVDYARTRIAFGRPIGSFQAIKHKCADMLVQLESARALHRWSLEAMLLDSPDRAIAIAMSGAYCSNMYKHLAAENIQVHGAMGFSWDLDAHLYLKRAVTDSLLLGTPGAHRRRLANLLNY